MKRNRSFEDSPRDPKHNRGDDREKRAPPRAETEADPPGSLDVPDDADALRSMQRTAGNQAVGRTLRGEPLPSPVKGRMEQAFGQSLDRVRVHSDDVGERVSREARAPAAASGDHLYFDRGEFTPETPAGEALIAHELAHVVHGHDAGEGETGDVLHAPAMEAEANRTAFAALANLWLGTRERIRSAARAGGATGIGRLLPADCPDSSAAIEAPDYLGPHSRETLERLNNRLESLEMLGPLIAVGTAGAVGFGPPSDPTGTVTSAAEALKGLPAIKRAIITQEVTLLLVEHENDMNDQEKAFWHRILNNV